MCSWGQTPIASKVDITRKMLYNKQIILNKGLLRIEKGVDIYFLYYIGVKSNKGRRDFMPRIARECMNTSFFHVIVQGVNKEFIFEKWKYKEKYLNLLKKAKEDCEIDIIAHAIMYNHAHLLLHIEDTKVMSDFMKRINEDYGRYYNYVEDRVGHVFRDRFLSEPITNERYLLNCIAYIHNNPVKANIVKKCEDYKFSSYKDFINLTGFIDEKIINLVFETKKLNIEEYTNLHKQNKYYFAEYDDMLEQNMQEIIREIEERYNNKIEKLINNPKILKEIVVEIKDRIKISNIQLEKFIGINRNKIGKLCN